MFKSVERGGGRPGPPPEKKIISDLEMAHLALKHIQSTALNSVWARRTSCSKRVKKPQNIEKKKIVQILSRSTSLSRERTHVQPLFDQQPKDKRAFNSTDTDRHRFSPALGETPWMLLYHQTSNFQKSDFFRNNFENEIIGLHLKMFLVIGSWLLNFAFFDIEIRG